MRRSLALPSVLLGLAAVAALSGAPASARTVPCGPASARTVATDAVARMYLLHGTLYGCSVHGSSSYALGRWNSCQRAACVITPVLAGEMAGYGLDTCGVDTCQEEVQVRRLTDGVTLRTFASVTGSLGVESFPSIGSLVLKPDGAVAWIGVGHAIGPPHGTVEVHAANAHGQPRVLDRGGAIGPHSLRLHRSTVSWKDAGRTLKATLR